MLEQKKRGPEQWRTVFQKIVLLHYGLKMINFVTLFFMQLFTVQDQFYV